MRPSELLILLKQCIVNRLPVLVTGPPGAGKSDIIAQAAEAVEADHILSHPAVEDPTDAKGFPFPSSDGSHATFLPFGAMQRAINADKLTLWNLEDLGQATPATQASYMALLLLRQVGEHKLSDHVTFVATTNRRTDKAGVSGILEPVKSRFAAIVELVPSLEEWEVWARDKGIPTELIAFLRFRENLFCAFKPSADLTNSPVPRTWAHVAKIMSLGLPQTVQHHAIAGAVGEAAAAEFTGFMELYKELPRIEDILKDPENAPIPKKPGTLYAVATALGEKSNHETLESVSTYIKRLYSDGQGEFSAMILRDALRRDSTLTSNEAMIRLATSHDIGTLVSGGAKIHD